MLAGIRDNVCYSAERYWRSRGRNIDSVTVRVLRVHFLDCILRIMYDYGHSTIETVCDTRDVEMCYFYRYVEHQLSPVE